MNKLFKHINEIINLTLEVNVNVIDRFEVLKKLLLNIYSEYAIINIIEDDTINNIENIDFPSFDYNEIYKKVEGNFSSLGYYHSIFDIKNIYSKFSNKNSNSNRIL